MTEPFCFRAEEIARLTDFQILSIKAAQFEKTKAVERDAEAGTTETVAKPARNKRGDFIHTATSHLGWTRERAEAAYDKTYGSV